ncbi:MAG: N-acetyltransferase [Candidatus Diapherotrites archaeon]|nr:N-acetyltransferase [Candidatus Diapherotrites archaeon]
MIHETAEVEGSIGEGTKVWHQAQVLKGARIGRDCTIGKGVFIDRDVVIGERVKVQNYACLYKELTVEDDVFIGPHACFTNDMRPRAFLWNESRRGKTVVRKGASIGANSTILCNIEIGEYAMVAAGSVVTKDVPAHALVMGNPAKRVAWVCECGQKLDKASKCGCGKFFNP